MRPLVPCRELAGAAAGQNRMSTDVHTMIRLLLTIFSPKFINDTQQGAP